MRGLYYVVMSLIGGAIVVLGWDSIHGVAVYQFALVFGGAILGHVITEALNFLEADE